MLIKNLSERSLRAEPVDKATNSSTLTADAAKPLDASSKVTNKHYSPLLRQVGG